MLVRIAIPAVALFLSCFVSINVVGEEQKLTPSVFGLKSLSSNGIPHVEYIFPVERNQNRTFAVNIDAKKKNFDVSIDSETMTVVSLRVSNSAETPVFQFVKAANTNLSSSVVWPQINWDPLNPRSRDSATNVGSRMGRPTNLTADVVAAKYDVKAQAELMSKVEKFSTSLNGVEPVSTVSASLKEVITTGETPYVYLKDFSKRKQYEQSVEKYNEGYENTNKDLSTMKATSDGLMRYTSAIDNACKCPQGQNIYVPSLRRCFYDLVNGLYDAMGSEVQITGNMVIQDPIILGSYDLLLTGVKCNGATHNPIIASLFTNIPDPLFEDNKLNWNWLNYFYNLESLGVYDYGKFELPEGPMFIMNKYDPSTNLQTVKLKNLNFMPGNDQYGGVIAQNKQMDLLALSETFFANVWTDVLIDGCTFRNFHARVRGGTVMQFFRTKTIEVTNSLFENNIIEELSRYQYEGGGAAIWIQETGSGWMDGAKYSFKISNSHFKNNGNEYWHGSGGAIKINNLWKTVFTIDDRCQFAFNNASDGGAMSANVVDDFSVVDIAGNFYANRAVSQFNIRQTARGGALKFANIYGKIQLSGTFVENYSEGRGGVIATTRFIGPFAYATIGGNYIENHADSTGAVWDNQMVSTCMDFGSTSNGFMCANATIAVESNAVFTKNTAAIDGTQGSNTYEDTIISIESIGLQLHEWDFNNGKTIWLYKDIRRACTNITNIKIGSATVNYGRINNKDALIFRSDYETNGDPCNIKSHQGPDGHLKQTGYKYTRFTNL